MRISLLLDREPFPQIVEQTLRRFWRQRFGRDFTVKWDGDGQDGGQLWCGNIYLNFFAATSTPVESLSSVRRDFGRSVAHWRRPAQKAYVVAATSREIWRWFAQMRFEVSPPCPDGGRCLIMGGNHRLRILDLERHCYYVILKEGTARWHVENEIRFRTEISPDFVPEIVEVSPDQTWFAERFVEGTGATRMPRVAAESTVREATQRMVLGMVKPSLQPVAASTLGAMLRDTVEMWLTREPLVRQALGGEITALARRLERLTRFGGVETATAWTHGDFQPSNIIADEERAWVIDWESVSRRFVAYDALTLGLASRHGKSLAVSVKDVLHESEHPAHEIIETWPTVEWSVAPRRTLLALYLLEELVYRMRDVCEAGLHDPAASLRGFVDEIRAAGAALQR